MADDPAHTSPHDSEPSDPSSSSNPLRNLPSVHDLLENPALKQLVDRVSHNVVVGEVRSFLNGLREELRERASETKIPAVGELADRIAQWIVSDEQPSLRPVINATGVLLHTGLGRSPLACQALEAVAAVSGSYASLEIDLATNERSQRVDAVERLLCQLTGAEAALVVNNNAGATLLALAGLAQNREVIVSRGQLVEIGGSYRLPDVMTLSGAVLREVGTTNKTRIADYESAVNEQTGALLRVHPSNYVIRGFTEEASLPELIELGASKQLPVIDDLGSGAFLDLSEFGLRGEPLPKDSIAAGADVVLFSGDKLLGGPQCGILVGSREVIGTLTRHPLTRALRVGKMTLAALAATLRIYREPENALREIPFLQLLSAAPENLRNRAERLAPQLCQSPAVADTRVTDDVAFLGGGSVPTQEIPTSCVVCTPASSYSIDQLSERLRTGTPSVIGRIRQDQLWIDLRTIFPQQDRLVADAFAGLVSE